MWTEHVEMLTVPINGDMVMVHVHLTLQRWNQIPLHNTTWRDFLLRILLLEPYILLMYVWKNQQMQQLFIQFINYVW
jgi:hypothetical protein